MMKRIFAVIALMIFFAGCSNTDDISQTEKIYVNQKLEKIFSAQNSKDLTVIASYLKDPEAQVRREAVLSMASAGLPKDYNLILPMLSDENEYVRQAAAYVLGLWQNTDAEQKLIQAINNETYAFVKATMLEALALCATSEGVKYICSFDAQDNEELKKGQAWALVRLARQKKTTYACTQKAMQLISKAEPGSELRQIASFYFAFANKIPKAFLNPLVSVYNASTNPVVKANLLLTFGKIADNQSFAIILDALESPENQIVVNAIKAAENFDYDKMSAKIFPLLTNSDPTIAISAASYFIEKGKTRDVEKYKNIAKNVSYWEIAVKLYTAVMKYSKNKNEIIENIQNAFEASNNDYEKALLLEALEYYPPAFYFVSKQLAGQGSVVIKTSAIKTCFNMLKHPKFDFYAKQIKNKNSDDLLTEFYLIFRDAIGSQDNARVYYAAKALTDPKMIQYINDNFENVYFLNKALNSLSFPRDFKTFFQLCETMQVIQNKHCPGSVSIAPTNIDFNTVGNLKQDLRIKIYTSKGEILIKLFAQENPVSVANFINLVKSGYYSGQKISQVIPNVGIFSGGSRGDGWENLNQAVVNEYFPYHFKTGTFALKNLGQNYQSTIWFITTYPAVQLDGHYTVLGEVVRGMDVVNSLTTNDEVINIEVLD